MHYIKTITAGLFLSMWLTLQQYWCWVILLWATVDTHLGADPVSPHQPLLRPCKISFPQLHSFCKDVCVKVCVPFQWDSPHCDMVQRHHCRGEHTPSWHMVVCLSPLHMVVQLHSRFHTETHTQRRWLGVWLLLNITSEETQGIEAHINYRSNSGLKWSERLSQWQTKTEYKSD